MTELRESDGYLRLIAILGHELRTPLTAIRGAATLVLQAHEQLPKDKLLQMLTLIDENSEVMAERIEDMLGVSHLEAGALRLELGDVPVQEIVEPALTSARRFGQAEVAARGSLDSLTVRADPERAVQALRSLLANAVRDAGRGGSVELRVEPDSGRVRFDVLGSTRHVAEIPHSAQELTAAAELNLYLAAGLAEAMGGAAGAEPVGDGGLRLWFTLERRG